jgi:type III restriction enzyme
MHDFLPDFLIRLKSPSPSYLILETKGYDPLEEVKREAAQRWLAAVNADGAHGYWQFALTRKIPEVKDLLDAALAQARDR